MHESVMTWVSAEVEARGLNQPSQVLEVGSYDVNGSVRALFDKTEYTGVDISPGPGVDIVISPPELPFLSGTFDTVVSTEMLEHAEFPASVLTEMRRVLKPGGVLLLTARSEGFGYHNPPDYHRFSESQMHDLLRWTRYERGVVVQDPQVPGVFAIAYKPG
jgi:SAM-dependent methyltransferase